MKKKILLTGANGFIGRSFIENIDISIYDIFALSNEKEFNGEKSQIQEYFSVDISKPFNINIDFDAIIHMAALNVTSIQSEIPYDRFRAVNVDGTKNVIDSCSYKKFIYFSTANLYDKNTNLITEDSSLMPTTHYERSKHEAELLCKEYVEKEKLIILRPVNITGVKQENRAMVPYFFSKAINNETIEIFVPENRKIQLLSVNDIIRSIEMIVNKENVYGTFNLTNTDSIEIKTLAEKIVSLSNSKSSVVCTNSNLDCNFEISSQRAKESFQWEAKDSINSIINQYAEYISTK